jgi:hypothetical protein
MSQSLAPLEIRSRSGSRQQHRAHTELTQSTHRAHTEHTHGSHMAHTQRAHSTTRGHTEDTPRGHPEAHKGHDG